MDCVNSVNLDINSRSRCIPVVCLSYSSTSSKIFIRLERRFNLLAGDEDGIFFDGDSKYFIGERLGGWGGGVGGVESNLRVKVPT